MGAEIRVVYALWFFNSLSYTKVDFSFGNSQSGQNNNPTFMLLPVSGFMMMGKGIVKVSASVMKNVWFQIFLYKKTFLHDNVPYVQNTMFFTAWDLVQMENGWIDKRTHHSANLHASWGCTDRILLCQSKPVIISPGPRWSRNWSWV